MRKIIILLLLMNGHDALLAWRKEGCGICGGRVGRDGVAIGMEGKGGKEGGMGQDGEWRKGARKAEKETRMKHAVPASCGGGEGSGVRRARRFSPPVVLEIDGRHRPSLPVGEVRTGRDFLDYPSDLYKSIHKSHQL